MRKLYIVKEQSATSALIRLYRMRGLHDYYYWVLRRAGGTIVIAALLALIFGMVVYFLFGNREANIVPIGMVIVFPFLFESMLFNVRVPKHYCYFLALLLFGLGAPILSYFTIESSSLLSELANNFIDLAIITSIIFYSILMYPMVRKSKFTDGELKLFDLFALGAAAVAIIIKLIADEGVESAFLSHSAIILGILAFATKASKTFYEYALISVQEAKPRDAD